MKKNLKKRNRQIPQATTPAEWRNAPRPNYNTNTDLQFPYSEYPRTFEQGYQYYSTKLSVLELRGHIVDFWGEGRISEPGIVTGFRNSYNINHQFQLVSNGNDKDRKIPNRVPTVDYNNISVEKYIPDSTVDTITLMGSPIIKSTAVEMVRMIHVETHSVIVIYGYKEDSAEIKLLETELDSIAFVLSPLYKLNSQLNEPTLLPKLAFCMAGVITQQATQFFQAGDMTNCAVILCSLQRSAQNQRSASGALGNFFTQDSVRNSYLIFKLGYTLKTYTEGSAIMSTYMNSTVVRIVQQNYTNVKIAVDSNYGYSYLCVNGKVSAGSWQWAFMASTGYLANNAGYNGGHLFTLKPVEGGGRFKIQSGFGSASGLCTNKKVVAGNWQWGFFGTSSYLDSDTYNGGQYFRLVPVDGGKLFRIEADFGTTAYLCSNGKVGAGSWQWAFFGSIAYLNSNTSYKGGDLFSFEFV